MGGKLILLGLAMLVLFHLASASATPVDVLEIEMTVKPDGGVFVQMLLSLDSADINALKIPVYDSYGLKVYDEEGDLNFSYSPDESIKIVPRAKKPNYSLTIEYNSDRLTSKALEEWELNYTFNPGYDVPILTARAMLPTNSTLKSANPSGIVYAENSNIKIEWNTEAMADEEGKNFIVRYLAGKEEVEQDEGLSPLLILIGLIDIGLILGVGYVAYARHFRSGTGEGKKRQKEFSAKQRDVMRTLSQTEGKIVETVFKQGGEVGQRKLVTLTGLPKSTLSRTLKKLQVKQLVELKSIGNTNRVELNSWFRDSK